MSDICVIHCEFQKIVANLKIKCGSLLQFINVRERIRQDILKTDDPIDAIEQMEIELNRLTNELTQREQKLAISSESVANIMRKTIQREQIVFVC